MPRPTVASSFSNTYVDVRVDRRDRVGLWIKVALHDVWHDGNGIGAVPGLSARWASALGELDVDILCLHVTWTRSSRRGS